MNINTQYLPVFYGNRKINTGISKITSIFEAASSQTQIPATEKSDQVFFIPDEKTLWSGGNASGISCIVRYSDDYSKDNPVVIAVGMDDSGKQFQYQININDIDPTNATYVELKTLSHHLGYGLDEKALAGMGGQKGRMNVFELIDERIGTYRTLKFGGDELHAILVRNSFLNWISQTEK
ncbi:MAG: hypothetical protein LBQ71_05390 [Hungatella sp.]|jgi:hypothetical protein|nr:hypothetical protein [Hungatella sp.]